MIYQQRKKESKKESSNSSNIFQNILEANLKVGIRAVGKAAMASPTTSRLPAKKTLLLNVPNVVGVASSQNPSHNTNNGEDIIAARKKIDNNLSRIGYI